MYSMLVPKPTWSMCLSRWTSPRFLLPCLVAGVLIAASSCGAAGAQEEVKIGKVTVDKARRTVTVNGRVNMREGLVEVLACAEGGKLHESVLVLDAVPHDIQAALLLIGLKPAGGAPSDDVRPPGDPVNVWVEWKKGARPSRVRGEKLVLNKPRGRTMRRTHWNFTGSHTSEYGFAADNGKTVVATYYDPSAILNSPLKNSYDDTLYYANTARVPPVGTPVRLVLERGKRVGGGGETIKPEDISLRKEADEASGRAVRWLIKKQDKGGYWSQEEHPALTALVVTGIVQSPGFNQDRLGVREVERGVAYILSSVRDDGGIYRSGLAAYNTSLCMVALTAVGDPKHEGIIRRARAFLAGMQQDDGEKGKVDGPSDGGFGYESGGEKAYADLSNTVIALEAFRMSQAVEADKAPIVIGEGSSAGPDWSAAIEFLKKCQHLRSVNKARWVSDEPRDAGSFIYRDGESKAAEKLPDGTVALRGYASMTYAGLLSMIYAEVGRKDPRVASAYEWLRRNYSLEENPGMGAQGLYYYYHTMAKALAAYGDDVLKLEDGREIRWRRELTGKLLELQKGEGHWVNENGRWWESDPVLVTAYALLTLQTSGTDY